MTEYSSTDGHRPARREDELVVRPVGDETVVYDLRTDRVTALDAATSAVWAGCDGSRDLAAIGAHAGLDAEETRGRLLQLDDAGLLAAPGATRRTLLRAGVIGSLVPLLTIAAADAAFAASAGQVTISSGNCGAGNRISVTVSITNATQGAHAVRIYVDGAMSGAGGTVTANANGSGSTTVTSGNAGPSTHNVQVRVYDAATATGSYRTSNTLSVRC